MDARAYEIKSNNNESATKRPFVFWFFVWLLAIGIDQLAKLFVFQSHSNINLVPKFVAIAPFKNQNFALSIPLPSARMYGIYILVLSGAVAYLYQSWGRLSNLQRLWWLLVIAGGVSNVAERIVLGYVRDFIWLYGGGVINIADIYITIGILGLLLLENVARRRTRML